MRAGYAAPRPWYRLLSDLGSVGGHGLSLAATGHSPNFSFENGTYRFDSIFLPSAAEEPVRTISLNCFLQRRIILLHGQNLRWHFARGITPQMALRLRAIRASALQPMS